ncbi:MAG: TatD family hydrolase [Candidatus Nezhaarchaeota archaeon]|nr:TatD family hydrolase [Candidatus Nezhaarchaeota archaeon]
MRFIDAHAHLEELEHLEEKLLRAVGRGLVAVVAASSDPESITFSLSAQAKFKEPRVFAAVGIHPWSLVEAEVDVEASISLVEAEIGRAVALGEVGLDYWLPKARGDEGAREVQREVFARQLKIAKEAGKPVVVHSRGAWRECLEMVKEADVEALFHWFSGPMDVLKELLDCGYYISATPAIDYSREHREAVKHTPLSRILSETDSPVYYKGRLNRKAEPSDVVEVVEMLSKLKEVSLEDAAEACLSNAVSFYKLEV